MAGFEGWVRSGWVGWYRVRVLICRGVTHLLGSTLDYSLYSEVCETLYSNAREAISFQIFWIDLDW